MSSHARYRIRRVNRDGVFHALLNAINRFIIWVADRPVLVRVAFFPITLVIHVAAIFGNLALSLLTKRSQNLCPPEITKEDVYRMARTVQA
jgi:hypothetical protein